MVPRGFDVNLRVLCGLHIDHPMVHARVPRVECQGDLKHEISDLRQANSSPSTAQSVDWLPALGSSS